VGAQSATAGEAQDEGEGETLSARGAQHGAELPDEAAQFRELLQSRAVFPLYQPIHTLAGGRFAGLEVLGRGRFPGLPEGPADLLRLAAGAGCESALSRAFRRAGVEAIAHRHDLPPLFLNSHTSEIGTRALLESLAELQALAPHQKMYLEVREAALEDQTLVSSLRAELEQLGIGLAYDGFGAGEARLVELAEVPPHFLKFDHRFVHGIDKAPSSRRRILSSLVAAASDLHVLTIAQGVETAEEAEVCARVGFTHGQGFFYGAPLAAEAL
jgi:EAL domain-containing protein (putative c-di-GMP-specific phosphodiesterase class I)